VVGLLLIVGGGSSCVCPVSGIVVVDVVISGEGVHDAQLRLQLLVDAARSPPRRRRTRSCNHRRGCCRPHVVGIHHRNDAVGRRPCIRRWQVGWCIVGVRSSSGCSWLRNAGIGRSRRCSRNGDGDGDDGGWF
jgi:hypothetical protein